MTFPRVLPRFASYGPSLEVSLHLLPITILREVENPFSVLECTWSGNESFPVLVRAQYWYTKWREAGTRSNQVSPLWLVKARASCCGCHCCLLWALTHQRRLRPLATLTYPTFIYWVYREESASRSPLLRSHQWRYPARAAVATDRSGWLGRGIALNISRSRLLIPGGVQVIQITVHGFWMKLGQS